MVGDRMTDVAAGTAAGCRTVLVQTGRHDAPSIVTALTLGNPLGTTIAKPQAVCRPDHTCADLPAAAAWILGELQARQAQCA